MARKTLQLDLPDEEITALYIVADQDILASESDNSRRMARFKRYLTSWRNRNERPDDIETAMKKAPKERVPLIQWQCYAKWAGTLSALFGDDAQIIAAPRGPSDQKTEHKVSRYMQWRVFSSMRLVRQFAIHAFRTILFGRAVAFVPYEEEWIKFGKKRELLYRGPKFYPLPPEDIRTPVEDVDSIHDFSWIARRVVVTPQQLLDGERAGKYTGITENWDRIVRLAAEGQIRMRAEEGQELKTELDEAQGVNPEGSQVSGELIVMWEWYGKRRLPVGKDVKVREMDETEVVVKILRDLTLVIGVQKLEDLYPRMAKRRPFVDSALIHDGTYWSAGLGELLEWLEIAISRGHNLFVRAVQFSVGPVILYDPATGFTPKDFTYEPFSGYPVEDPQKIQQLKIQADLSGLMAQEQTYLAYGERITGQTDQAMGRASDRPNAPRTASGQFQLLESGNIRASLDTRFLREDFSDILSHIWQLDTCFTSEDVFFRATEEEAKGLFEIKSGGATITMAERAANYDFDVKFATSIWQREAKKQEAITLFQLGVANPLIMQNPTALWAITNQLYEAFGNSNFGDIIPRPPELDRPKNPREEWTLCLQGEEPPVNPLDNDDLHLADHYRRVGEEKERENNDQNAINMMVLHILEHQKQKRQKLMMQALAQQLTQTIAANTADPSQGGLNARMAQPLSLMGLQQQMAGITDPAGQLQQQGEQAGTGQPPTQ